jgi:predicted outer membrane lipoprotein
MFLSSLEVCGLFFVSMFATLFVAKYIKTAAKLGIADWLLGVPLLAGAGYGVVKTTKLTAKLFYKLVGEAFVLGIVQAGVLLLLAFVIVKALKARRVDATPTS